MHRLGDGKRHSERRQGRGWQVQGWGGVVSFIEGGKEGCLAARSWSERVSEPGRWTEAWLL